MAAAILTARGVCNILNSGLWPVLILSEGIDIVIIKYLVTDQGIAMISKNIIFYVL